MPETLLQQSYLVDDLAVCHFVVAFHQEVCNRLWLLVVVTLPIHHVRLPLSLALQKHLKLKQAKQELP